MQNVIYNMLLFDIVIINYCSMLVSFILLTFILKYVCGYLYNSNNDLFAIIISIKAIILNSIKEYHLFGF